MQISGPTSLQTSSSSRRGSQILEDLADSLSKIGICSHPEGMSQIFDISKGHSEVLVSILERLPAATIRPIVECFHRLSKGGYGAETPQREQIFWLATHLGIDPRSYREAVRTLLAFSHVLRTDPELDEISGRCLRVLNDQGVLGLRRIRELARFLVALDKRPGKLRIKGCELFIGDEDLNLHDLEEFSVQLNHHSKLWGKRAAAQVLFQSSQSFGALTRVRTPLRGTLVVDEPSLALIPGRSMVMAWSTVHPIPDSLKVANPAVEMAPYIDLCLESDWRDPELRSMLDVIYAGLRVVSSIVQTKWMSRLRLRAVIHREVANRACYRPDIGEIHFWRGPLSAYSVVHEMAHAIDDLLFDGPGLASDHDGHPLASFAAIVRPEYRPMAEKRAQFIWRGSLEGNFSDKVAKTAMSGGKSLLSEVIDSIDWPKPFMAVVAEQLLVNMEPLDQDEVDGAFGERMGSDTLRLLNMLQHGIVRDGRGAFVVDWERSRSWFMQQELDYLLSNREIFARFFDQYARLYWNDIGHPYGPVVRPGDLDPFVLHANVPEFHTALLEAQIIDMGHIQTYGKEEAILNTAAALGISAVLIGVGADLIR